MPKKKKKRERKKKTNKPNFDLFPVLPGFIMTPHKFITQYHQQRLQHMCEMIYNSFYK